MQKDYIAFTKEMKKDYTVLIPNMVEILQNLPGDFFDFIARVDHIHSGVDSVAYLDGQNSGVTVKVLCFALEVIKTMGVLQMQCGETPHFFSSL